MKTAVLTEYEGFGMKGKRFLRAEHHSRLVREVEVIYAENHFGKLMAELARLRFTHIRWDHERRKLPIKFH